MKTTCLCNWLGLVVLIVVLHPRVEVSGQTANFKRGDSNVDSTVGISDAIHTLGFLFLGEPKLLECQDAADSNDNGTVDIVDATYALGFLFLDTPAPPLPFPDCGPDPTEDALDCAKYAHCPQGPTLDPIGNLTVPLGTTLTLNLTASDPNGDRLSFSALPLPLPENSSLTRGDETSAVFTFTPSAEQVGDLVVTFTVSDGIATDSETVTISVEGPTPESVTALTGRIVDTNDFVIGVETPVEGATVSLLNTNVSTLSDAEGMFVLTADGGIPAGSQILDIDAKTANQAPDGSRYASFREEITIADGVNNVVSRPFFLPREADGVEVNPDEMTMVCNPEIGQMMMPESRGACMEVEPHSAKDEDGNDFTGTLSISEVPEALTPAALPEELDPGLVVTIQPVGVTFETPAPITFPNIDDLPAGTSVDIWSLDPTTGTFVVVGTGTVSEDGLEIVSDGGVIRAADWHFTLPPQPVPDGGDNNGETDGPGEGTQCPTGSRTSIASGNLTVEHDTVSFRSMGQSRALKLVYNSLNADPRPIITSTTTIPVRAAVPRTVSASLSVGGADQGAEIFTSTVGLRENRDEMIHQAVQFDASLLQTGVFPYELILKSNYVESSLSVALRGNLLLANLQNGEVGSGWRLAGVQRLLPQRDSSVLLLNGNGSLLRFAPVLGVLVESTFDRSTEDWTTVGDARSLRHNLGGGNPGGHICAVDRAEGIVWFWSAPSRFLGDKSDAYNGILRYDLTQSSTSSQFNANDVELTGNGLTLIFDTTFNPRRSWTHYEIPLNELAGWRVQATGRVPTQVQFMAVLLSITRLLIRAEFVAGFDTDCLDNVAMEAVGDPPRFFESPAGESSRLSRDSRGRFKRTFRTGRVDEFDADGLYRESVDRNGNTTAYAHDDSDRLISITDPVGMVTKLDYEGDLLASITDPTGRATRFEHDAQGNLVRIVDPDGSERSFEYDARHRMVRQVGKTGSRTDYDYNFAGRHVRSESEGCCTREIAPSQLVGLVDTATGIGTRENPAPLARPEEVLGSFTDGNGHVTSFEMDRFGAATQIIDALERVTRMDRDDDSNITASTQPNGAVTQMGYDDFGNLLTLTQVDIGATTTFAYDPVFNQVTSITDPNGNETTISYDAEGNPVELTDAVGSKTMLTYDAQGLLTSVTDALGNTTEFEYSARGNLVLVTDPLGNSTTLSYDASGNVAASTDAEGKTTQFAYDVMNQLIEVVDANAGVTGYEYDSGGNLTTVTDANGGVTQFEYDSLDRLVKTTDPLGKFETFKYDANGNVIQTTDRKLQTIDFSYTAVNQLGTTTYLANFTDLLTYDEMGNLTSVRNPASDLSFTYDAASRLISTTTTGFLNRPDVTIDYTYDKNGNRLTMADSVTGTTTYVYDALNRLASITNPSSHTVSFTYDALSRRTSTAFPNGTSTTFAYDAISQLTALGHKLAAVPFASFDYTYDNVGNRTTMNTARTEVTVNNSLSYTYDNLHRLIGATTPLPTLPDETFAYDSLGNRNPSTQIYDAANRLLDDGTFTYDYDDNGNLVSKTEADGSDTNYLYDEKDQLIHIGFPDATSFQYFYDSLGRRIEKRCSDGTFTRYIYDNEDIVLEFVGILGSPGDLTARYTHGAGIDEPVVMQRDLDSSGAFEATEAFYYHADGLGSVTDLTDNLGAVAQSYVYQSFGNVVAENGSLVNPYTYTGREFDAESGLYYYRARYYSSQTGRFISQDPDAGDLNRYRYVGNNPINFSDPQGLRAGLRLPLILRLRLVCLISCFGGKEVCKRACQKRPDCQREECRNRCIGLADCIEICFQQFKDEIEEEENIPTLPRCDPSKGGCTGGGGGGGSF